MYISRIELNKICCFDSVDLNLKVGGKTPQIVVFLGNNGMGKTTILRSIALGLCDPSSTSGLLQELYGDFLKEGEEEGWVRLTFTPVRIEKEAPWIKTTFTRTSSGQVSVSQETNPRDDFPWDDIFVCGYGAARAAFGTIDVREYSVVDSVYTLFNYDAKLQNPELILRRIKDLDQDPEGVLTRMLHRIDNILMLPEGSTQLAKSGVTVTGPWGEFMPHGVLGDGHRAMLALISDFIGWALFHDEKALFKNISGVLLIDEIEQHLHPDWQRKIVRLLNDQFPEVQFVFTTHSPLVAANSNTLLDDDFNSKLFHLRRDRNRAICSEVEENLGELDIDQVLSSEAFDHIVNINPKVAQVLRDASILAAKDIRTPEENTRLVKFKLALKQVMFPEGRSLIERIIERDYYTELEKRVMDFTRILEE